MGEDGQRNGRDQSGPKPSSFALLLRSDESPSPAPGQGRVRSGVETLFRPISRRSRAKSTFSRRR